MKSSIRAATLAIALACACRVVPGVSPMPDPQLEAMIEQQAESAAPSSVMVSDSLLRGVGYGPGDLQDFYVEMTVGQCYVVVGAGDGTVASLHLTVWDPRNRRVGQDRAKSRQALVQHCPLQTGSYKIQGKIGDGAGHFAIGVFGKKAPERVVVAPRMAVDLEQVIQQDAAALAPGAEQVGAFYTGNSKKNEFFVQLDQGTCYWLIGAAQPEVDDYYIYLWNQRGKRVGESKTHASKANLGYCASETGMYKVQVKVDDARGEVKLGLFTKNGP